MAGSNALKGSPFGTFEFGAGIGGDLLGGGNPGVGVGQTRTFLFEIGGSGESSAGLSASSFFSSLSTGTNKPAVGLVRFRGFENGGSDNVVPVPLPAAVWGGAALLGAWV